MTEEQIVERVAQAILDVANAELQLCDAEADDFARAAVALLGPAPLEWGYQRYGDRNYRAFAPKKDAGFSLYWINESFGSDAIYFRAMHDATELYDGDDLEAAKAAVEAHRLAAWWAQTVAGRAG